MSNKNSLLFSFCRINVNIENFQYKNVPVNKDNSNPHTS